MNENELGMKDKGESRIWSEIFDKNQSLKKVAATQTGQQLLLEEGIRILPKIRDWIDNKSSRIYRHTLQQYFTDDDILLEKITFTFLLLSGSIYMEHEGYGSKKVALRQPKINSIRNKIFQELDFDTVWRFVEAVVDYSRYFDTEKVKGKGAGTAYNKTSRGLNYTCKISDTILAKLTMKAYEAFYPLPMRELPQDWIYKSGVLNGGYRYFQRELIRTNKRAIDYSKYDQKIFDSVNYIQSVPWTVNEEMVRIIGTDLKYPQREDFIKQNYPDPEPCEWEVDLDAEGCKLSEEEIYKLKKHRKVFLDAAELYRAERRDLESAIGKYRAVKMALDIAEKYFGDIIYFPHSYDFRGRIYPLPVGLSPQGSDAVKAMLEYAEGEVLNERGIAWMWAYLATLYGDDKLPFDERVSRGKELLFINYNDADEPYQFLAHQNEIHKYFDEDDYEFKGRVHLDACNSGSQFTSAITGDEKGCYATNVIPTINKDGSQTRQDAYMLVADRALSLTIKLIDYEEDKDKLELLEFLKGLLISDGRKICKNPVMVSNYGGTAGGRSEILWNMFRELGVERKWITKKNANLFSKIIGESIYGVLNGGKAFEIYIHRMNNVIAKQDKPIKWTTSDGFYVVHVKNKELKPRQVSCMLPGSRRSTTILKKGFSQHVSPTKMKSAISPNYIHSLDAELLRGVALRIEEEGVEFTDWIHDSFGCHPNHVDLMLEITKDEFSLMVMRQPLKVLDKELRKQAGTDIKIIKALNKIHIPDLGGVDLDGDALKIVKTSNWFFS